MSAILRVKDENGNWIEIPAIQGEKGDRGERGERGEKGEKGDTPSLDGYATEQYLDDAIANIELPEASGGGAFTEYVLMDVTLEEEVSSVEIAVNPWEAGYEELKKAINECDEMFFLSRLYKPAEQTERGAFKLVAGDGSTGAEYGIAGTDASSPSSNAYHEYQDSVAFFHFNRNNYGLKETVGTECWVATGDNQYNNYTTTTTRTLTGNQLRPVSVNARVYAKTATSFGVGSRFVVIARKWNR